MTSIAPDLDPGFDPDDAPLPPAPLSEEDAAHLNADIVQELAADPALSLPSAPSPEVVALRNALAETSLGEALMAEELNHVRSLLTEQMAANAMLARRVNDLETQRDGLAQLLNALAPVLDPDRGR